MLARSFLAPTALALTLFASACSPRGSGEPEPAAAPTAAQAEAPPKLAVGTKVEIQRNNKWLPGAVVQVTGDKWLVSYDGWGSEWNETVAAERIRALPVVYKTGDKVLVQMANRLAAAEIVMQATPTLWRVHYDGYGPEVGEIVGPARLKPPFAGKSAHAIGDAVGVEFQGQVLAGKVLQVAAADRFIVRFPAFGPDYDQEVTLDRVRPAPPEGAAAPTPTVAVAVAAKGPGAAPAPAGTFAVNDQVFVSQRNGWVLATVHAPGANGTWKVHYEAPISGDDDVAADRLMKAPQPLKGQKYQANQPVYIEWHGMFVGGKVLKEADPGAYKVRYDGLGPESDEVLPAKRLRVKAP
jgi:Agenet domain